jgi:3-hydroxyacyl-[acyl-carrier protein] dehydratase/trans-2-decenoyl-[acyl-carrier protein] isomerase
LTYEDFLQQKSFDKEEILAFSHGTLLEDAPAKFDVRLPIPPMLMVDRILEIRSDGSRGRIVAERDVSVDDWFFQCHFVKDPVQPGCLGVDGVWQLLGFYCARGGGMGSGRALGCGSIEFSGQIRPHDHCVRYEIDIRRFTKIAHAGATLVIGDATLLVDDEPIYEIKHAKVGTFQDIGYPDYPMKSTNSRGGKMKR